MQAFDRLPFVLREALRETPANFSAEQIEYNVRKYGLEAVLARLAKRGKRS